MKKISIIAVFLTLTAHTLFAQDCKNYYYLLNNAEVDMTVYDGKGTAVATNIYKVTAVKKEGTGMASDFNTTVKDKDSKVISTGKGKFKCTGSDIMVDMQMSMPNIPQMQSMKMEAGSGSSFLSYPSSLKTGQTLPDGEFTMSGNANGMETSLQYRVSDRKVGATEKITTAGGSWECFKITYNVNLSLKMMAMNLPMEVTATEWFAPGFGVVKTEYYRDSRLMGSSAITGVKK